MSIDRCNLHDKYFDTDQDLKCPICEQEIVDICQKLEDGELGVLSGAEDLRERGASDEEIEKAVGLDGWRWIRTIWKQQEARRGHQS